MGSPKSFTASDQRLYQFAVFSIVILLAIAFRSALGWFGDTLQALGLSLLALVLVSGFAVDVATTTAKAPPPVVTDASLAVLAVAFCSLFALLLPADAAPMFLLLIASSVGASIALSRRGRNDVAAQVQTALQTALHDAIVSERDIVPLSAQPFYSPELAAQSEQILSSAEQVSDLTRARPSMVVKGMARAVRATDELRGLHRKHFD